MNTKVTKETKAHEGQGIDGKSRRRVLGSILVGLTILFGAAIDAAAQPAALTNATVETRAVSGALGPVVDDAVRRSTGATWVAYAVPAAPGHGRSCCGGDDTCCTGCRLDTERGDGAFVTGPSRAPLEPSPTLHVFARVAQGRVERVRMFSDDCAIDGSGATVHWLTGVSGTESVAWLAGLAESADGRGVADGALAALAFHGDEVAVDRLIQLARTGAASRTRSQALFWLSQRASARAVGVIRDAIDSDPETAVKRQAVFALSQLPADEGVPRLIDVARAHSNASVRRQAMFWLGQSKDPRALEFFAEILRK